MKMEMKYMVRKKSWDKMTKMEKKQLRWEEQNLVYGKGYLDKSTGHHKSIESNMATRGYDAMRISPQKTTKFGDSYRAVYGASLEPDYRGRPDRNGNYPAKVTGNLIRLKSRYHKSQVLSPKSIVFLIVNQPTLKQQI